MRKKSIFLLLVLTLLIPYACELFEGTNKDHNAACEGQKCRIEADYKIHDTRHYVTRLCMESSCGDDGNLHRIDVRDTFVDTAMDSFNNRNGGYHKGPDDMLRPFVTSVKLPDGSTGYPCFTFDEIAQAEQAGYNKADELHLK